MSKNLKKGKETILVVDSDRAVCQMLEIRLPMAGYRAIVTHEGRTALALVEQKTPALVGLDALLPDIIGYAGCRPLRERYRGPIMILSALSEIKERILGLEAGADDYITKPFSPRELEARIATILRRTKDSSALSSTPPGTMRVGQLQIDTNRQQVYKNERRIWLTYTEFKLLELLFEQAGEAVSRAEILEQLWGYAPSRQSDLRVIDVYVARLRAKIEDDPKNPELIITIRGFGYVAQRYTKVQEAMGA